MGRPETEKTVSGTRKQQRLARALAARDGVTYQQALQRVRDDQAPGDGGTGLAARARAEDSAVHVGRACTPTAIHAQRRLAKTLAAEASIPYRDALDKVQRCGHPCYTSTGPASACQCACGGLLHGRGAAPVPATHPGGRVLAGDPVALLKGLAAHTMQEWLEGRFPGTRFSVRPDPDDGSTLEARWVGDPTVEQVQALAAREAAGVRLRLARQERAVGPPPSGRQAPRSGWQDALERWKRALERAEGESRAANREASDAVARAEAENPGDEDACALALKRAEQHRELARERRAAALAAADREYDQAVADLPAAPPRRRTETVLYRDEDGREVWRILHNGRVRHRSVASDHDMNWLVRRLADSDALDIPPGPEHPMTGWGDRVGPVPVRQALTARLADGTEVSHHGLMVEIRPAAGKPLVETWPDLELAESRFARLAAEGRPHPPGAAP